MFVILHAFCIYFAVSYLRTHFLSIWCSIFMLNSVTNSIGVAYSWSNSTTCNAMTRWHDRFLIIYLATSVFTSSLIIFFYKLKTLLFREESFHISMVCSATDKSKYSLQKEKHLYSQDNLKLWFYFIFNFRYTCQKVDIRWKLMQT